ncbi:sensor histidine kinase [Cerasicoccus maritimus]|uniref:sensor histidine kinase n=1 Tax=Cerasicoccus maritimus TaxID=490089 RepID=UPI002852D1A8|nr:ATP-binding protein [Cerasicoccus maritimus]
MPLSLKWKIQLWHALILGGVLAVLGTGFYFYEKSRRQANIDQRLDQKLPPLIGQFSRLAPRQGPSGMGMREPGQRPGEPINQATEDQADANGAETWTRSSYSMPSPSELAGQNATGAFEHDAVADGYYAALIRKRNREFAIKTSNFPNIDIPYNLSEGYYFRTRDGLYREILHVSPAFYVIVGVDLHPMQSELNILKLQIIGTTLFIFIIGLSVGYVFVNRSLRPLRDIEITTQKIALGELYERIPESKIGRTKELVDLTDHLNHTFEKMEDLVNRQVRFTADASHELRTPLTALMAQIALGLKRERTVEEYIQLFKVSQRSAQRIQRITEQLIELSKFDSGRVDLEFEELPLDGMLIGLTEELQAYVSDRGSELKTNLATGIIRCDPFRLEQVITNLVNNAIQHNIRPLNITLRGWFDQGNAVIEVSDDGKGIKPENIDKLFDRFFQESVSHTSRHNNVGLGLAISKAIVEAHGGVLSARSTPEVETTFRITLPQSNLTGISQSDTPNPRSPTTEPVQKN